MTAPAPSQNALESDGRGYRCIHCEVRNDVQFCHYHEKQIVSLPEHDAAIAAQAREDEREKVLNELDVDHITSLCDAIIEKQDPQSQWGFNALLIKRRIESLRTGGEPR